MSTAWSDFPVMNFRGLKQVYIPEAETGDIRPGDSEDNRNVYTYPPHGALRMRDGYSPRVVTALPKAITGLEQFILATGSSHLMSMTPSNVYRLNTSTDAWVSLHSAATGDNDDLWKGDVLEDTIVLINGVDKPLTWDGSASSLTEITPITNFNSAKAIKNFQRRIWLGNYDEGGTNKVGNLLPSNIGVPGTYTSTDSITLNLPGGDEIRGLESFSRDKLIAICDTSIFDIVFVGGPIPFSTRRAIAGTGTEAAGTIALIDNEIVFLGDDNVWIYNGRTITSVGDDIQLIITNDIEPSLKKFSVATVFKELNLYILLYVPNAATKRTGVLAYDYRRKNWFNWEFAADISVFGHWRRDTGLLWQDLVDPWDTYEETWDAQKFLTSSARLMLGAYDGFVHEFQTAKDDDTTAISAEWESHWSDLGKPNNYKEVLEMQLTADEAAGTTITLELYVDGNSTTVAQTRNVTLSGKAGQTIVTKNVQFRQLGRIFKVRLKATKPFSVRKLIPRGVLRGEI